MISKLLLGGALAAALAAPGAAQVIGGPGDSPPIAKPPANAGPSGAIPSTIPPVDSGPVRGATPPIVNEGARVGAAANVSAIATDADLRPGAAVKDAAGADLGRITKVDRIGGQTMVTLSSAGRTTTVPATSLTSSPTGLVSSTNKADVWAPR